MEYQRFNHSAPTSGCCRACIPWRFGVLDFAVLIRFFA